MAESINRGSIWFQFGPDSNHPATEEEGKTHRSASGTQAMLKKKLLESISLKFQRQVNSRSITVGSRWGSCGPHLFASSRKVWQVKRVISRAGHPDHVELRYVSGNVEERLVLSVDALQLGSQLRPLRD